MYSPKHQLSYLPLHSNQTEYPLHCIASVNSTQISQLSDHCCHLTKAYQAYLSFKKKLLTAMHTLDPLDILQSGIFQQYQQYFHQTNSYASTGSKCINQLKKESSKVSDFEALLQTYQVQGCKVTQLQRRSHSCDSRIVGRKERQFGQQQIKNVQFILWSNTMAQINDLQLSLSQQVKDSNKVSPQGSLQKIKAQRLEAQVVSLRKEVERTYCENSQLSKKMVELENNLRQVQKEKSYNRNEIDDYRLQYLLKEKQFHKKIQEAREQIDHLRNLLQNTNEAVGANKHQVTAIEQKGGDEPLRLLREKVEREGRMRRTLQQLWVCQLKNECNEYKE